MQYRAVITANDDKDILKPHALIHNDEDNEQSSQSGSDLFRPKQVGRNHITNDHEIEAPCIRSCGATDEMIALINIAAEPGAEKFSCIGIAHNHTGQHGDLGHLV